MVVDQLPRLGKRELICLLLFTCNYVVFVWRGFFFLWVLGMGYVILLWHSLSLPYNYFFMFLKLSTKIYFHFRRMALERRTFCNKFYKTSGAVFVDMVFCTFGCLPDHFVIHVTCPIEK